MTGNNCESGWDQVRTQREQVVHNGSTPNNTIRLNYSPDYSSVEVQPMGSVEYGY